MQCQKRTDTTYGCPVIGRREVEMRQEAHRKKLQSIKSGIDTRAPAPQPHLTLYGRDYVSKKRATTEAAFSDLKMIQTIAKTMTREHHLPERKGPMTLNTDNRKHEIYRIMKENHKLLEHIENVEPWIKSSDMVKDHRMKQRYVINASHTMRLSGDYDPMIAHFRRVDQTQIEETKHRIQARLMRSSGGSVSLPSLTPNGARGGQGSESPEGKGDASAAYAPPVRAPDIEVPAKAKGPVNQRTCPSTAKGVPSSSASSSGAAGGNKGKSSSRGTGANTPGKAAEKAAEAAPRNLAESELQASEMILAAQPEEAEAEITAETTASPEAPELPEVPEAEAPGAKSPETEAPVAEEAAQLEPVAEAVPEAEIAEAAAVETADASPAEAEDSANSAGEPAKQEEPAGSSEQPATATAEAERPPAEASESPAEPVAQAEKPGDEYEDEYEEDFANDSMSATMKKKETIEAFEESANFEEESTS